MIMSTFFVFFCVFFMPTSTSWNMTVISAQKRYGDNGHPCLILVCCSFQFVNLLYRSHDLAPQPLPALRLQHGAADPHHVVPAQHPLRAIENLVPRASAHLQRKLLHAVRRIGAGVAHHVEQRNTARIFGAPMRDLRGIAQERLLERGHRVHALAEQALVVDHEEPLARVVTRASSRALLVRRDHRTFVDGARRHFACHSPKRCMAGGDHAPRTTSTL